MDPHPLAAHGQPPSAEARETSATTTALIVMYARRHGGDDAVADQLSKAGLSFTADELEDPSRWFSYETRIRLLESVVEVVGDPDAPLRIGETAVMANLTPSAVLLIRALGSPRQAYRHLPMAVTKFSTVSSLEVREAGWGHATIAYRLRDGYRSSRHECQYARGLMSTVPLVWSLPHARIEHTECAVDGHPACIYHVTWQQRRRLLNRFVRRRDDDVEVRALRAQLEALQSAASDLVDSDDLSTVLGRITERAASAVVAPGYVLAVHGIDGRAPIVHSSGLDVETARETAARLLADDDLGPHAVVVDVATSRRHYGRLAALYGPAQRGLDDESSMLAAYAAHAAAALELLLSLESARRGEARSRDLLALAHHLAAATSEQDVADVLVETVPHLLAAPKAALLRWDASTGLLQTLAAHGLAPDARALLLATPLRPDETPELAEMLTRHEPTLIDGTTSSEVLQALLGFLEIHDLVAMPLLANDTLLGVVCAARNEPGDPDWPDAEAVARLRGVADQASSAMHNARLLSQIRHQAHHDGLTGLPNRMQFLQSLDEQLARPETDGSGVAVLCCDLDGFKQINDRYGHAAGDEVLRQVSARLRAVPRTGDMVARLSGDEFAVTVRSTDLDVAAGEVAARVLDAFAAPFRVDGRELRLSTSVGVATEQPGDDADQLLRRADGAMYQAKQRGRNQLVHATGSPRLAGSGRTSATDLRDALVAGHVELHYQPIVRIGSGTGSADDAQVVGHEALARWRHPDLGLLSPAAFLPDAEETGAVVDLDGWVLRTAIAAAATWDDPHLDVAVNVSAQTLGDRGLPSLVRHALTASGLAPGRLMLEVIESRSLVDLPGVADQLAQLRQMGIRISLDDFGTGYSTLTWLHALPIDQIKLDRSFVADLAEAQDAHRLVAGALALAAHLGIPVVAEGVEDAEQLAMLRAVGCELVQGYLFARPDPVPRHHVALLR